MLRTVVQTATAMPASDGAGVRLFRALGTPRLPDVDPFLMLDEFRSDEPSEYIAGFPDHPHRGFETITIMLAGAMEHKDSRGNTGRLGPGSVQWMIAGAGIVHSEMPKQENGLMWGFQLWLNLPAHEKMQAPSYHDIAAREIPEVVLADGVRVRLIAGTLREHVGPVRPPSTRPFIADVTLVRGAACTLPVSTTASAFAYVVESEVSVGDKRVPARTTAVLGKGDEIELHARDSEARVLVVCGEPLGEPVARYGPFVMNTHEELEQAFADYRAGRLQ